MSLIQELKRRNVIRVAGLYLVGAWLITQVAGTVLPMFGAPDWLPRSVVILVALGFIPMLVFSWVFELTPEGIKRDAEVRPDGSIAPHTARRMDRIIIAVLICALVYFALDKFMLAPRDAARSAAASPAATGTAPAAAAPVASRKSIAVLPFTDLSPGHDQEYFSDGMAEELLNALAKIKDLKVAGRTSSFHFKGKNDDLREIGHALGVANILEGSVRKQGDKVRITAQLIQTEDGFHLWSGTYDGDLSDVFNLQERIARAISEQLKVIIGGDPAQRLVPVATTNSQAYGLYLQATDIFNRRDFDHYLDAIGLLEQALKLDPNYARAQARIAILHASAIAPGLIPAEAQRHARLAIAADASLAEPHLALGAASRHAGGFLDARDEFERAQQLEPDDAAVGFFYAQDLLIGGYTHKGTERLDRVLAIDPMQPNAIFRRGIQYSYDGDQDAAERAIQRSIDLGLSFGEGGLVIVAAARGDFARARDLLLHRTRATGAGCADIWDSDRKILSDGVYGGDAAARAKALAVIEQCLATRPAMIPAWVPVYPMRLDEPAKALAATLAGPSDSLASIFNILWSAHGRSARCLPEFGEFARKMGLADLWEKYGPPDRCHRVAPRDFACE
jgi:TolB-like protein